jgi:hypothetical protein
MTPDVGYSRQRLMPTPLVHEIEAAILEQGALTRTDECR